MVSMCIGLRNILEHYLLISIAYLQIMGHTRIEMEAFGHVGVRYAVWDLLPGNCMAVKCTDYKCLNRTRAIELVHLHVPEILV